VRQACALIGSGWQVAQCATAPCAPAQCRSSLRPGYIFGFSLRTKMNLLQVRQVQNGCQQQWRSQSTGPIFSIKLCTCCVCSASRSTGQCAKSLALPCGAHCRACQRECRMSAHAVLTMHTSSHGFDASLSDIRYRCPERGLLCSQLTLRFVWCRFPGTAKTYFDTVQEVCCEVMVHHNTLRFRWPAVGHCNDKGACTSTPTRQIQ
jgi:hypothetical protein